MDVFNPLSS